MLGRNSSYPCACGAIDSLRSILESLPCIDIQCVIIYVVTIQLQTTLCANQCQYHQVQQEKALPLQLALSVKMSRPSAGLSHRPHHPTATQHFDPIGRTPQSHHSISLLAVANLCLPKMNKCDSRTVHSLPTRLSSYVESRERLGSDRPEAGPEAGARICPPILLHCLHPAGDRGADLHQINALSYQEPKIYDHPDVLYA
jgi:hypothetical protein